MRSAERYRRRLESHVAAGRFDAGLALLDAWQAREPRGLEPELLRARVDFVRGRYRAAYDRFLAAVRARECPPESVPDVVEGLRLFSADDELFEWAVACPGRARIKAVDQARAATALTKFGAHALAQDWADEAVAKAPDDGICRANRALIRQYAGDFAGAQADLEHVIGGPQESALAHWLLSRLRRQSAQDNHIARLRDRLALAGQDPRDREFLLFALFKELDDLGQHEAAWAALEAGCRSVALRMPYDARAVERLFAALARQPDSADVDVDVQPAEQVPVFIVGLHRSGTTLVESILAAHPDVYAYGESQRFSAALRHAADYYCPELVDATLIERAAHIDHRHVREHFLRAGRRLSGGARFVTEKMPGNFQLIGLIRCALPEARIVHVRREPMDLCFANLRELFADGVTHAYGQQSMAHYHAQYAALMAHWKRVAPDCVLDIAYEDLVADPAATSRRMFEFCGLQWDAGVVDPARWAARPINTLSAVQARGPVSRASVGRWRSYARWLQPLQSALVQAQAG